jgi:hypothetical protein
VIIKPGQEILVGNGLRFRVLDVVPFDEEDESRSSGCYRSKPSSCGGHARCGLLSISSAAARGVRLARPGPQVATDVPRRLRCRQRREQESPLPERPLRSGRGWDRTSDPSRVKRADSRRSVSEC